ncbi:pentapeptide repeat-containing protein [Streptomyces noursei]|uniref:pentapeptide repeat-containing protein n=1 Tax=Streptomyces noursei TaxID=1971 RepID=UPI0023B77E60|nr:pentapeptide repeat-containing protein [Streptomyces noursei]
MVSFEDQDLTDAEFRECDLTRARLTGVVMRDVVVDGLVSNLVVNGVEVTGGRARPAVSSSVADALR